MNRKHGQKNQSKKQLGSQLRSQIRNQYGLALWIKIVIGLFATCLIVAIAVGVIAVSLVKDVMDPKKTQEAANKMVTMVDPLPAPFEYGRFNMSVAGYSFALINDINTKALYILMQVPKKPDGNGAQKMIEAVAKGESMPTAGAPGAKGSEVKNSMQVEKQGDLDVAGQKMYYVLGKAARTSATTSGGSASATSSASVETFLGATDPKDPAKTTLIMVQQPDESKHLTLEEVQAFLADIKALN